MYAPILGTWCQTRTIVQYQYYILYTKQLLCAIIKAVHFSHACLNAQAKSAPVTPVNDCAGGASLEKKGAVAVSPSRAAFFSSYSASVDHSYNVNHTLL